MGTYDVHLSEGPLGYLGRLRLGAVPSKIELQHGGPAGVTSHHIMNSLVICKFFDIVIFIQYLETY